MIIDKEKLKAAFSQIEKQHGAGTVFRLGGSRRLPVDVIPTRILALDKATGVGGLPRGRVVEIYGPESGGKTTLCLQVIAEAQRSIGAAAFIDAEHALDPVYAKALGVDIDNLIVSQPDCGEQALEVAEVLIASGQFAIIVVDSVAALTPRKELEGEMGDPQMGLQARLMSQALRKLCAVVAKSKTCLIFINQTRQKIGVMFGNPETTTGGNALKFYASMRITVRTGEKIKSGDNRIGSSNKIQIIKNKVAAPFKEAIVDMVYGQGFEEVTNNLSILVDLGLVEKSGSWYSCFGERLGQGGEGAVSALQLDTELYGKLYAAARDKIFTVSVAKPAEELDGLEAAIAAQGEQNG